jgi:GNAT superfamily N-acetyltransferase
MSVDVIQSATKKICDAPQAAADAVESVSLRRATGADASALALLGAATFLEAFTWMLPGADIVAHCAKHHTAAAYEHYLAQSATRVTLAVTGADVPVGYAMLTAPELPTFNVLPTDIELKRIYLFSRFRAAPVLTPDATSLPDPSLPDLRPGQALMNAAINDAIALQRKRLLLGTHAGNLRAIGFYRRNGFIEAGTRTFQVGGQTCCDVIFSKQLCAM